MNIKTGYETFQGSLDHLRFAVVVSQFHSDITNKLLEGVVRCFESHGVKKKQWNVFYCPGSFELPQVANRLAASKKWNAIICLGAVIRGETPHFEYVCAETARGIQEVALRWSIPVVFGVLTTNTLKQAQDRVGGKHGHKGWDAALTAFHMATLFKKLDR
ncbi:MAG: 6,7-dimethyl-8-ribityllumazine synthase [Bacteroidetes bacterium]|nr:6,7-dimethyl-8-ribityllumazine synthase [Bacteroidota bacterium]